MKTLKYFLVLVLLAFVKDANAQSVHGFRIGIGYGTTYYAATKMAFITRSRYSLTDSMFTENRLELVKFIEHTWLIDEGLTIGLGVSHNTFSMKNNKAAPGASKAEFRQATITFRTQYAWLRHNNFQLYSSANFGYSFIKQYQIDTFDPNGSVTKAHQINYSEFATYLNPIGILIGKKIGGFVELGIGFKGIISGGMFVRFM